MLIATGTRNTGSKKQNTYRSKHPLPKDRKNEKHMYELRVIKGKTRHTFMRNKPLKK